MRYSGESESEYEKRIRVESELKKIIECLKLGEAYYDLGDGWFLPITVVSAGPYSKIRLPQNEEIMIRPYYISYSLPPDAKKTTNDYHDVGGARGRPKSARDVPSRRLVHRRILRSVRFSIHCIGCDDLSFDEANVRRDSVVAALKRCPVIGEIESYIEISLNTKWKDEK